MITVGLGATGTYNMDVLDVLPPTSRKEVNMNAMSLKRSNGMDVIVSDGDVMTCQSGGTESNVSIRKVTFAMSSVVIN